MQPHTGFDNVLDKGATTDAVASLDVDNESSRHQIARRDTNEICFLILIIMSNATGKSLGTFSLMQCRHYIITSKQRRAGTVGERSFRGDALIDRQIVLKLAWGPMRPPYCYLFTVCYSVCFAETEGGQS